jgi:hypothetical protein
MSELTRWSFIRGLFAGAFAFGRIAKAKQASVQPHLVHVSDARHPTRWPMPRVILEGVDISNVCQRVEQYSDGTMWCLCLCKNPDGSYQLTPAPNDPRHDLMDVADVTDFNRAEQWRTKLALLKSQHGRSQDVVREWKVGKGSLIYPRHSSKAVFQELSQGEVI